MLAGFLNEHVSTEIESVEGVELEYADQPPLDPQTLLGEPGEPGAGTRGANQTSPDVAFVVRTKQRGRGLVLTENKLTEHSFYPCSGRKAEVKNPDATRCMNWANVQADPGRHCWQMNWEKPGRPNRTYWKHIRLSDQGKSTLTRCPAATAAYQLFRQQALAEAIAGSGRYQFVASCVAYDARNDDLIHSLRSSGVENFVKGWGRLFDGRAQFAAWTHQDWVSWVRAHDEAGDWAGWLDYVEERYGYGEGAH